MPMLPVLVNNPLKKKRQKNIRAIGARVVGYISCCLKASTYLFILQ